MIPTSDLNPLGQIFEREFLRAWELFEKERFDEANAICRSLIAEPRISNLHKAGCHLILAHSPDDYLYHAEQALELFKDLYPDANDPPNEDQRLSQNELIKSAENVLEGARADSQVYANNTRSHQQQSAESKPGQIQRLSTQTLKSILEARRASG